MNTTQSLLFFGVIALTTAATRALPFLLFPDHKETPRYVQYLGRVLPFTIIGMLVVYCLRSTTVTAFPFGLPELIALAVIAALHIWKKNTLLSIGAGTVAYMLLVQVVFA